MCHYNSKQQDPPAGNSEMINPYYSYLQMLLPLMASSNVGESASAGINEAPEEVTIAIYSDNARCLSTRESMTMRSKHKAPAAKRCRWSSVPDIAEISKLLASKPTTTKSRRSSDDLRSLMLNNSRAPRSTDDLRNCQSTGSLLKRSGRQEEKHQRKKNDSWDRSPLGNSGSSRPKNPFDLRMPIMPLTTTNSPPAPPLLLSRPSEKLSPKTLILKKPQRQSSAEAQRDLESDTKSVLQKFLKNLKKDEGADSEVDAKKQERTTRDMPPMSVQRAV
ncbi:expressed unknown protein [Seminavis robusta]|uniref:Uncharacterized protein n=1 Tax=Seminavis robusta TaxID=568900 RepID=A0A9N8E672_9STRA|nr:expressed unknown protein [Seminavis robusta]|eukprot:Sro663_g183600.1 n/a (276) ;mRNA; r:51042-51869